MVTSVHPVGSHSAYSGTSDKSGSVALQDKLARCVRQLGDWEACPSGKTPEGKKIIENLKSQISNIEARINVRVEPRSQTIFEFNPKDSVKTLRPESVGALNDSSLGSLLNVYA